MNSVELEYQGRRAEEWAQWDLYNIPPAPVLNRGRGRKRTKFHLTFAYIPQNLEDVILDLHKCQLAEQQQRTTQEPRAQIIIAEVERQR